MSFSRELDFWSPAFKKHSYATYALMRQDAPVHQVELLNKRPVWLVTRYDDVLAVLKDPRFVKNARNAMTPEQLEKLPKLSESGQALREHMLSADGADHARLRGLVHKAFTPRLVEGLRPRIQQIADDLLDQVESRGDSTMDLIDEYAFPLPITVIAELLGIPSADRDRFREWSNVVVSGDPMSDQRVSQIDAAMSAFIDYLRELVAERRARPQDDLISALIQAEEAGDKLSERELYAMIILLIVAGHETTVNLIGNGVLALLTHPDQMALLQVRPDLIGSAVEELLRYDGPVETSTMRYVREDVTLGGVTIPRGDMVLVVLGSADHDERRFANPEELDIARRENRHIAFGYGIHFCLGAPLARLEGQIALATLLRRMPNLRLAVPPEELVWRLSTLMRSLEALPVAF